MGYDCEGSGDGKARELLKSVDVGNYMLDTKELVTAKLVQTYLGEQTKESAWKLIQEVVEDTVLLLPADKGAAKGKDDTGDISEPAEDYTILSVKLELLHSEVVADRLVRLIDDAVESMKDDIQEEIVYAETEEAVAVREIALQVIEGINGKQTVENITLGFLCFLADCYKALR